MAITTTSSDKLTRRRIEALATSAAGFALNDIMSMHPADAIEYLDYIALLLTKERERLVENM